MNYDYFNRFSRGETISAEEFSIADAQAAELSRRRDRDRNRDCDRDCDRGRDRDRDCNRDRDCDQDCNCERDCDCDQDCDSTFGLSRSVCRQIRNFRVDDDDCCCKQSFRVALQLLGDERLAELLDFDGVAFITDHFSAGVQLDASISDDTPTDNLSDDPEGIFRRFSQCNCDLLDISAELYNLPSPSSSTGVTVTQVSLCELIAVIIGLDDPTPECECSEEETRARTFRRITRMLSRCLTPCDRDDDNNCRCPSDCDDCCCAAGLLSTLSDRNLSRRVSLVAGPLILSGVTLLGTVGNVLVLANDEDYRIYFVCVNSIEFLF